MKLSKNSMLLIAFILVFACFSCREAKETADDVSDYATGKTQIEKGQEMEDKLKNITDQHNQKQEDALKELSGEDK